jgi:hypothetical protein
VKFIRIQFDENTKSFKLLEGDGAGMFSDGDVYLIAVAKTEPEPDAQWIHQAIPKAAHA